jgi:hypothetical protein
MGIISIVWVTVEVIDPLGVECTGAADQAVNLVAFRKQQLC